MCIQVVFHLCVDAIRKCLIYFIPQQSQTNWTKSWIKKQVAKTPQVFTVNVFVYASLLVSYTWIEDPLIVSEANIPMEN